MAPIEYVPFCRLPEAITISPNSTTMANVHQGRTDTQALLYIVVTLLFYSLGIIIGIISYLKREKQEMQEDKTYQDFFNMKCDPFLAVKSERVQQFAARVQFFEQRKKDRELEEAKRLSAGSPTDDTEADQSKGKTRIQHDNKSRSNSFADNQNTENDQIKYAHKRCQTGDICKETGSLSKARKLVRILTPTPSRSAKKTKQNLQDKYNDKKETKDRGKNVPTLLSPTLSDYERSPFVSFESDRPNMSQLTPRLSLPEDETSSMSTLADSPRTGRRSKSPMLYIDASTDDERAADDRSTRAPLIQKQNYGSENV